MFPLSPSRTVFHPRCKAGNSARCHITSDDGVLRPSSPTDPELLLNCWWLEEDCTLRATSTRSSAARGSVHHNLSGILSGAGAYAARHVDQNSRLNNSSQSSSERRETSRARIAGNLGSESSTDSNEAASGNKDDLGRRGVRLIHSFLRRVNQLPTYKSLTIQQLELCIFQYPALLSTAEAKMLLLRGEQDVSLLDTSSESSSVPSVPSAPSPIPARKQIWGLLLEVSNYEREPAAAASALILITRLTEVQCFYDAPRLLDILESEFGGEKLSSTLRLGSFATAIYILPTLFSFVNTLLEAKIMTLAHVKRAVHRSDTSLFRAFEIWHRHTRGTDAAVTNRSLLPAAAGRELRTGIYTRTRRFLRPNTAKAPEDVTAVKTTSQEACSTSQFSVPPTVAAGAAQGGLPRMPEDSVLPLYANAIINMRSSSPAAQKSIGPEGGSFMLEGSARKISSQSPQGQKRSAQKRCAEWRYVKVPAALEAFGLLIRYKRCQIAGRMALRPEDSAAGGHTNWQSSKPLSRGAGREPFLLEAELTLPYPAAIVTSILFDFRQACDDILAAQSVRQENHQSSQSGGNGEAYMRTPPSSESTGAGQAPTSSSQARKLIDIRRLHWFSSFRTWSQTSCPDVPFCKVLHFVLERQCPPGELLSGCLHRRLRFDRDGGSVTSLRRDRSNGEWVAAQSTRVSSREVASHKSDREFGVSYPNSSRYQVPSDVERFLRTGAPQSSQREMVNEESNPFANSRSHKDTTMSSSRCTCNLPFFDELSARQYPTEQGDRKSRTLHMTVVSPFGLRISSEEGRDVEKRRRSVSRSSAAREPLAKLGVVPQKPLRDHESGANFNASPARCSTTRELIGDMIARLPRMFHYRGSHIITEYLCSLADAGAPGSSFLQRAKPSRTMTASCDGDESLMITSDVEKSLIPDESLSRRLEEERHSENAEIQLGEFRIYATAETSCLMTTNFLIPPNLVGVLSADLLGEATGLFDSIQNLLLVIDLYYGQRAPFNR